MATVARRFGRLMSAALVAVSGATAQEAASGGTFEAFPILAYDTNTGFGAGVKLFALNFLGARESFDVVLFASTLGERWGRAAFSLPDLELRQGTEYPVAIDVVAEYDRLVATNFFGVGNDSRFDDREIYSRRISEVSVAASRGFTQHIVGQAGVRYRSSRNFNFEDGSALAVLPPTSNAGTASTLSAFGSLRYDTRNSFIRPSRGLVLQAEFEIAPRFSFASASFRRASFWAHHYRGLGVHDAVFAARLGGHSVGGSDLPIQTLIPLGSSWTLRGFLFDRYLDRVALLANAEIRFGLFWRVSAVLGVDAGKVWHEISAIDLQRWAYNGVVGLRFNMDTFVVRADVGLSGESTGVYLNFGHIF